MMASIIPKSVYHGPPATPAGPKGAPPKALPSKGASAPSKPTPSKAAPSKAAPTTADEHKPKPRPGVPAPEAGHPPLNRIPIVDHKGNMRGHVGHSATQATVARFLGRHGAKLGKHEGRVAWIGDVPPPPPPPDFVMGPTGPMMNPKAVGKGTEREPVPGRPPLEDAKGEAEIGLINARRDAIVKGGAKPAAKPKPKK